jgi:hypothetical protein
MPHSFLFEAVDERKPASRRGRSAGLRPAEVGDSPHNGLLIGYVYMEKANSLALADLCRRDAGAPAHRTGAI